MDIPTRFLALAAGAGLALATGVAHSQQMSHKDELLVLPNVRVEMAAVPVATTSRATRAERAYAPAATSKPEGCGSRRRKRSSSRPPKRRARTTRPGRRSPSCRTDAYVRSSTTRSCRMPPCRVLPTGDCACDAMPVITRKRLPASGAIDRNGGRIMTNRLLSLCRAPPPSWCSASVSASRLAAATITIVNGNAPGVGFNDPTPAVPVGGNPGVTLGQQRLNAFAYAASLWGAELTSSRAHCRSRYLRATGLHCNWGRVGLGWSALRGSQLCETPRCQTRGTTAPWRTRRRRGLHRPLVDPAAAGRRSARDSTRDSGSFPTACPGVRSTLDSTTITARPSTS